jgi:hypothetical protein
VPGAAPEVSAAAHGSSPGEVAFVSWGCEVKGIVLTPEQMERAAAAAKLAVEIAEQLQAANGGKEIHVTLNVTGKITFETEKGVVYIPEARWRVSEAYQWIHGQESPVLDAAILKAVVDTPAQKLEREINHKRREITDLKKQLRQERRHL